MASKKITFHFLPELPTIEDIQPGGIYFISNDDSGFDTFLRNNNNTKWLSSRFNSGDIENRLDQSEEFRQELTDRLGSMAFEDAVELAKLGQTIIEGGYIKTNLIDVNRLRADIIDAQQIIIDGGGAFQTDLDNLDDSLKEYAESQAEIAKGAAIQAAQDDAEHKANAAKDYAELLMNNLNIGGTNLLNFEGVVEPTLYFDHDDNNKIKQGEDREVSLIVKLEEGKEYSLSRSYIPPIEGQDQFQIAFSEYHPQLNGFLSDYVDLRGETEYEGFTVPTGKPFIFIYMSKDRDASQVRIDKWKLEEGNKKTDWSPSPSDVDAAIQDAKDLAEQADTARQALSDLMSRLSPNEQIDIAKLGETLIQGGYIRTTLLDANAVRADIIAAGKITADDIETGTITADNVDTDSLKSALINAQEIVVEGGALTEADLDDLDFMNKNMIVGGDFSSGTINYNGGGNNEGFWSNYSISSDGIYNYIKGSSYDPRYTFKGVVNNDYYSFGFYAKPDGSTSTRIIQVFMQDSNNDRVSGNGVDNIDIPPNEWTWISGELHPTSLSGSTSRLVVQVNGSTRFTNMIMVPGRTQPKRWYASSREIVELPQLGTTVIQGGYLQTNLIEAGSISASKIASNAITAAKISANAVTTEKINSSAITAGKIASNAITAAKIASGAITTAKLASGSITADKIDVQDLFSKSITATNLKVSGSSQIAGFKISGNTLVNNNNSASLQFTDLNSSNNMELSLGVANSGLAYIRTGPFQYGMQIITDSGNNAGIRIEQGPLGSLNIDSTGAHNFIQRPGAVWNAPGLLGGGYVVNQSLSAANKWSTGNITLSYNSSTKRVTHNIGHNDYFCIPISFRSSSGILVEAKSSTYVEFKSMDDNYGFGFILIGRNRSL